jgi:hypothetical protein
MATCTVDIFTGAEQYKPTFNLNPLALRVLLRMVQSTILTAAVTSASPPICGPYSLPYAEILRRCLAYTFEIKSEQNAPRALLESMNSSVSD